MKNREEAIQELYSGGVPSESAIGAEMERINKQYPLVQDQLEADQPPVTQKKYDPPGSGTSILDTWGQKEIKQPKVNLKKWSNDSHLQDINGVYWMDTGYRWEESNKATYKGAQAYEKTYNKCVEKKITGMETEAGVDAIYEICNKKGEKSKTKAIRKYSK